MVEISSHVKLMLKSQQCQTGSTSGGEHAGVRLAAHFGDRLNLHRLDTPFYDTTSLSTTACS